MASASFHHELWTFSLTSYRSEGRQGQLDVVGNRLGTAFGEGSEGEEKTDVDENYAKRVAS